MKKNDNAYWWCQLGGWGAYMIMYTFFYFTIRTKPQPHFFEVLVLDAGLGICITHIMRFVIQKTKVLELHIKRQIIYIIILTFAFAFLYSYFMVYGERRFGIDSPDMRKYSILNNTIRSAVSCFLFLAIWNLIYFSYHFVMKSQQAQTDRLQMQSVVKELELKTIKAHINPHFIFNALNSIRALVDENPVRARTAITQLSNILRSSMYAEKLETASLEKELGIVKDYLALEHVRFEDRLKVEYNIDDETLGQQVPPMMLQTLVENAIKHGISRQVAGGIIKISSSFKNNVHELVVDNTGKLSDTYNPDGFGIASTHDRLKLLYGGKAVFSISEGNNNVVAKITLPI